MSDTSLSLAGKPLGPDRDWLEVVRQHVTSLRYGVVEIIVHDAHVTQIEKTERVRLEPPPRTAPAILQAKPPLTLHDTSTTY